LFLREFVIVFVKGKPFRNFILIENTLFCYSPEEAKEKATGMLNSYLVTKQTDAKGRLCREVGENMHLFIYYFH
jgi:hypothetical protein